MTFDFQYFEPHGSGFVMVTPLRRGLWRHLHNEAQAAANERKTLVRVLWCKIVLFAVAPK